MGRRSNKRNRGGSTPKPSPKSKGGFVQKAKNKVAQLTGKGKGKGFGKKRSAKLMLKRAYERKAKMHIRVGNLGQARRLLRKKATVI